MQAEQFLRCLLALATLRVLPEVGLCPPLPPGCVTLCCPLHGACAAPAQPCLYLKAPVHAGFFFLPAFLAQQWLALLALVLREALGFGSVSVTRSLAWVRGGRSEEGSGALIPGWGSAPGNGAASHKNKTGIYLVLPPFSKPSFDSLFSERTQLLLPSWLLLSVCCTSAGGAPGQQCHHCKSAA